MTEFASAHQELIFVTRRGFTFLLANGIGWIIVGILAQRWPVERTATLLLVMGAVTTPVAFGLRALLGLPEYTPDNPLNRLGLLLAFTPAVSIPAVLIAYFHVPRYMPSIMAAILGGHFLPYSWLYQTHVYLVLGIVVALTPGLLMWAFRARGFAAGPLCVGVALLIAAAWLY